MFAMRATFPVQLLFDLFTLIMHSEYWNILGYTQLVKINYVFEDFISPTFLLKFSN